MTDIGNSNRDVLVALARKIAQLEKSVEDLAGEDGFGFSSVESGDGPLVHYDEDGNERLNVGIQDDGRFAVRHSGGSAPPKPTAPDCDPVLTGVLVTFDGTFEDDEDVPSDLAYYEVHSSVTPGYDADDTNMIGTMYSPDGGSFVHGIISPHTEHYYSIVAVDHAGNASVKSDEVACVSGGFKGYQDGYTTSSSSDLTFNLTHKPLPNSTIHFYWNNILQEDDTWSLDEWTFTVVDDDGAVQAGDRFYVKYLYVDPGARPAVPASLLLVGASVVTNGASSIALPAGTVAGDLLVLTMVSRSLAGCDCADSRFTVEHDQISSTIVAITSLWIGYGHADGSGAAIPITLPAGTSGASRAELAVFRVTGTVASVYTAAQNNGGSAFIPAVSVGDMGIVALIGETGVVADHFDNDSTGEWTPLSNTYNGNTAYSATHIAYSLSGTPNGHWGGIGSACVAALAIGLTEG